jgi:hypothetical protein
MPGTLFDGLFTLFAALVFIGIPLLIRWGIRRRMKKRRLSAREDEPRKLRFRSDVKKVSPNTDVVPSQDTPVSEKEIGYGNGLRREVPLKYLAPTENGLDGIRDSGEEYLPDERSLNVLPPNIIGGSLSISPPAVMKTRSRLSTLPPLKAAVVWREILGPPKGLDP